MSEVTLGEQIGQNIGIGLKSIANATNLSALDSKIESFTNKNNYSDLIRDISVGKKILDINGTKTPFFDGKKIDLQESLQGSLDKFDKAIKISEWAAPTRLALSSLDKMGEEIDKTIKDSFLLQTFNVKATDILCSAFCFLISTLPCSTRNDIYKAIKEINKASQAIKSGTTAINDLVSTAGAVVSTTENVKSTVNSLFSKNKPEIPEKGTSGVVNSVATAIAVPANILKNIKIIINALNLGLNFKFMMPDLEGKSLWDMSRHVLFLIESQAMQAADEALSKLIQPIEDLILGITPSICFGTMAVKFQESLIRTIRSFKSYVLEQLNKLLVGDSDFNIKFREYGLRCSFALELRAFAIALEILVAHFFDIAIACGVAPCGDNSIPRADEYRPDDIGNLSLMETLNTNKTSPNRINDRYIPEINNIEDIAKKLSPALELNNTSKTYVTPTHITSVYDLGETPKKIIDIINGGGLDDLLNDTYTIYQDPNSNNITIVNNIQRNCNG